MLKKRSLSTKKIFNIVIYYSKALPVNSPLASNLSIDPAKEASLAPSST
jgi:hypothetical protein